jgi:two-component sensor histidine kinase/HAMP domain-containing protein
MQWRFADLPVRTKFMFTLAIPVLGMILVISKQVDSNLKRSVFYEYIKNQAERISLFSNVMHHVQRESAYSVGFLTGQPVSLTKLQLQYTYTDEAIAALQETAHMSTLPMEEISSFSGLNILRVRVAENRTDPFSVSRTYRAMDNALLEELGRVGKLALDPETKDRFYAHLRLLNAKEALSVIRDKLSIALGDRQLDHAETAELSEQISQYEANMFLFEKEAPPEVMNTYREMFQGPDVNFMRSVIGTVKERRVLDPQAISAQQWWEVSLRALDKLKLVEDHSLELIEDATAANSKDARVRLFIVLAALIGVIGAVTIMGFVIMRGVRNTVNEVAQAARALSVGDVRATVPVNSNDEIGQMAMSFNGMINNIRSLASSAEAIGKGNYDTTVTVRGPQDVLGNALLRMKENLKAAKLRDTEQTIALQEEKKKIEQANDRIQLLIKEMHHRVKNNLQVVASLLRLQAGTISDERLQHAFDQSQSRVTSMALIHEKLYKGDELSMLDVGLYIQELFEELVRLNDVSDSIKYTTDIDTDLALDLHTMVPLGLLLNELITNSFKHAFKGREEGSIKLSLHRVTNGEFDLIYQDNGVGIPASKLASNGDTLGVSLIESLVEQLNGRMTVDGDLKGKGTEYHIRFKTLGREQHAVREGHRTA